MKILVDSELTDAKDIFSHLGRVELFEGRMLTQQLAKTAQILIVRSVTTVDRNLLQDSDIRFVGSATSGQDHVDTEFLENNDIKFASAAGTNAKTVAEHVLCCIVEYLDESAATLEEVSVGLVGYGHVGRAVGELLDRLSVKYCAYDPFVNSDLYPMILSDFNKVLGSDVVSLHVPLTHSGTHPTHNLIGSSVISELSTGALLINTARGNVLDQKALLKRLTGGNKIWAAIDCWADEPDIDPELAQAVWRATPHIAGYSREAKRRAILSVYESVCKFLGVDSKRFEFPRDLRLIGKLGREAELKDVLNVVHPLSRHNEETKKLSELDWPQKAFDFDNYRAEYGLRNEFSAYQTVYSDFDGGIIELLAGLGFVSKP